MTYLKRPLEALLLVRATVGDGLCEPDLDPNAEGVRAREVGLDRVDGRPDLDVADVLHLPCHAFVWSAFDRRKTPKPSAETKLHNKMCARQNCTIKAP